MAHIRDALPARPGQAFGSFGMKPATYGRRSRVAVRAFGRWRGRLGAAAAPLPPGPGSVPCWTAARSGRRIPHPTGHAARSPGGSRIR